MIDGCLQFTVQIGADKLDPPVFTVQFAADITGGTVLAIFVNGCGFDRKSLVVNRL